MKPGVSRYSSDRFGDGSNNDSMNIEPVSPFEKALVYASRLHGDQKRKGTDIPYISHPLAVASIVLENGGGEAEAIAALLHDVVEDCGGPPVLEEVRRQFGARVATIVEACSDAFVEDASQKPPWRERKEAYHEHLRACSDPSIYLVSAADKLHNALATLTDLRRIGPQVWSRFKAGRAGTLWNYRELVGIYAGQYDARVNAIAERLQSIVNELEAIP